MSKKGGAGQVGGAPMFAGESWRRARRRSPSSPEGLPGRSSTKFTGAQSLRGPLRAFDTVHPCLSQILTPRIPPSTRQAAPPNHTIQACSGTAPKFARGPFLVSQRVRSPILRADPAPWGAQMPPRECTPQRGRGALVPTSQPVSALRSGCHDRSRVVQAYSEVSRGATNEPCQRKKARPLHGPSSPWATTRRKARGRRYPSGRHAQILSCPLRLACPCPFFCGFAIRLGTLRTMEGSLPARSLAGGAGNRPRRTRRPRASRNSTSTSFPTARQRSRERRQLHTLASRARP